MSTNASPGEFKKLQKSPESPHEFSGKSPLRASTWCSDASVSKSKENTQTSAQMSSVNKAGAVCTTDAIKASEPESVTTEESKSQPALPCEAHREEPTKANTASNLPKSAVVLTLGSSSMVPATVPTTPKIIVSATAVRPTTPMAVGTRVVSRPAPAGSGETSGAAAVGTLASRPGDNSTITPNQVRGPTVTPAPVRGATMALPRTSTPQQTATVSRSPQTTSLSLPANFQVPQGMLLVRSDRGQLMLVSQQALAQAQAQGLASKAPVVATPVRPQVSQATATSIIRVSLPASPATVATIIKPATAVGAAVFRPTSTTGTSIIKSYSTGSTIIKPATVVGSASLKPSSTAGNTVIRAPVSQRPPSSTCTGVINQKKVNGIAGPSTSAVTSVGRPSLAPSVSQTIRPVGSGLRNISPNIPIKPSISKASVPVTVTAETLENVKKCKNFLVTLMKLASSGTRSANMEQNVRALVKDLLDGKLEAEEFTEKLYMELKSSPQPYLVPFLKRSLPAVRQLTPNSQLFIQQCDHSKQSSSSTSSTTNTTSSKVSISSSSTFQTLKCSSSRPSPQVIQQPQSGVTKQPVTTSSSSHVALPAQNRIEPKPPIIQNNTQVEGAFGTQHSLQASKAPCSRPPPSAHTHSFKDSTAGSFRDDDDLNDVTSMAGVNVNEERACILAAGAELVGSVVRSCKDEPFLQTQALQQRVQLIGTSLGVEEVNPEVLQLLSHATQERLRDLLEKLNAIAQHRSISYKNDWRYSQISDTRSQLKFLEQLDRVEKQRREEEEREALLRIAKSRSTSEDPEQLRLKQRAKEMQQLELAQIQHREANLAALAALGPRKRKPLEASSPGANQALGLFAQRAGLRVPVRVTFRDLIFCMEQDASLRHSLMLYNALLQ